MMGPNGYNALGNALLQTGGILDRLNENKMRQDHINIEDANAKQRNADTKSDRDFRNNLLLAQLVERRVKANRELDAANRKQREKNNADLNQFAQTSYVTATGTDDGNMHITDEGEVNGARRVYDPNNPESIENFRANLAENEIRNREETDGSVTSKDVRGILSDSNSLNTSAGQRVMSSYYRPENDQANRDLRATQQRERIAASASRQQKAINAAVKRSAGGSSAGLDVPTLTAMLTDAKQQQTDLLTSAGDNYRIGMDRGVDAQMSVITANIKNIQNMLNKAQASAAGAKASPTVPNGNPLQLDLRQWP